MIAAAASPASVESTRVVDWFLIYTVRRNGADAAWKFFDTLSEAIGYVAASGPTIHEPYSIQGFDDHGLSAVVRQSSIVDIELSVYRGAADWRDRRRFVPLSIERRWIDGVEVAL